MRYLKNCILLWLPPLLASFMFWPSLGAAYQPTFFWADIPDLLGLVENTSRIGVITLSALLIFGWQSRKQRTGWAIYSVGIVLYVFCQWGIVADPSGAWATSPVGFLAPAYTPAIWIIGLGLVAERSVLFDYRWVRVLFWLFAGIFIVAHNWHALIVFSRMVGLS